MLNKAEHRIVSIFNMLTAFDKILVVLLNSMVSRGCFDINSFLLLKMGLVKTLVNAIH